MSRAASGSRRSFSSPRAAASRSCSRSCCPGTRSPRQRRPDRPEQRLRARRLHVCRGRDPARRRRRRLPRLGARAQKGFHLPGGDGVAITLAGGWACCCSSCGCSTSPPSRAPAWIGIQWGLFGALLVRAGALIAAGARVRAAHRAGAAEPGRRRRRLGRRLRAASASAGPDRRPRDASAVTEFLREPPGVGGRSARAAVDPRGRRRHRLPSDFRRSAPRACPTTAPRRRPRGCSRIPRARRRRGCRRPVGGAERGASGGRTTRRRCGRTTTARVQHASAARP